MLTNKMNKLNWYEKHQRYLTIWMLFMLIFMFGFLANTIAVTKNNCRMPVINYYVNSDTHFGFFNKGEVNYWYLSDIIDTPRYIFSIGDLLMVLGFIGMLINCIIIIKLQREWKKIK